MDFYAYQRPVGKIADIPALRDAFITIFDQKTKEDAVRFGLLYGRHLIDTTGIEPNETTGKVFEAMQRWLDGKSNYHEARSIAFDDLYRMAREENDEVKLRYFKTMAQVTCIPHVKFHALWATDFAITLVNRLHPDNLEEVRKEREAQIALLKSV
jgi:hypothetical protein